MTKKKQAPEEIINKLGKADVVTGMGRTVAKGNRRGREFRNFLQRSSNYGRRIGVSDKGVSDKIVQS